MDSMFDFSCSYALLFLLPLYRPESAFFPATFCTSWHSICCLFQCLYVVPQLHTKPVLPTSRIQFHCLHLHNFVLRGLFCNLFVEWPLFQYSQISAVHLLWFGPICNDSCKFCLPSSFFSNVHCIWTVSGHVQETSEILPLSTVFLQPVELVTTCTLTTLGTLEVVRAAYCTL